MVYQNMINEIFKQYQIKGYVSEDLVFDAIIDNDISLDQVDYICETLLSMGVIIKNEKVTSAEREFALDKSQTDFEEVYNTILEIDGSLKLLIERVRSIVPPQNKEWMILIPQAQNGNLYARDRLVDMYLRIVIKLALQYHQRFGISLSDAIQDGSIGLIIAIEKFDIGRHDNFSQYVPWWIRQNIMREAELPTSCMRYPVHYKDRMFIALEIMNQYECPEIELYNISIVDEISTKLNIRNEEAINILKRLIAPESIEVLVENESYLLSDEGDTENEIYSKLDNYYLHEIIMILLDTLNTKSRDVLCLRYGIGNINKEIKTLEEVGEIFNLTKERIRQIESKAIKKLINNPKLKFWYY